MSSFLEDLNALDDSPKAKPSQGDSPFLIGLQESDGMAAPADPKRSGIVGLAIALVLGGGGLYAMRTVGLSANIALADTEIDYTAQSAAAAIDHTKLISDLHGADSVVQIPLKDLPINPFAWNAVQPVVEEPEIAYEAPKEDPSERLKRERAAKIESTFALLKLNSILSGPKPVVRISGEFYRLGDVVEDYFTVEAVDGRSVTLRADGKAYTLTIGQ